MLKNTSVMGVYADRTTVSDAITVLHKSGFRATDTSVLLSENQGSKDFAHEKHTKAPEGAATGAAAGAVVGAAIAWFASIQSVSITGLAPLVAAGPVLAGFAGAGVGGALGWIAGLLAGARRPEYVAVRYAGRVRRGGILLSVRCDSLEWCDRAKKTLKATGARNISSASEAAADYGTTDKPTERAPAAFTNRGGEPIVPAVEYVAHQTKEEQKHIGRWGTETNGGYALLSVHQPYATVRKRRTEPGCAQTEQLKKLRADSLAH